MFAPTWCNKRGSLADRLLAGETNGMAIDFTSRDGKGAVSVKDTTTSANIRTNVTADSWLTNSGTSPKLVRKSDGTLGWSPHNGLVGDSQDLTGWTKTNITSVTANATTDPTGTSTASKIIPNATSGLHYVTLTVGLASVKAGGYFTISGYLKAVGYNFAMITCHGSASNYGATVDLSNGTYAGDRADAGSIASISSSVTDAGNSWYLVSAVFKSTETTNMNVAVLVGDTSAHAVNVTSWSGDTTSGVYAWGIQVNHGIVRTPYLKTTAAAVIGCPISHDGTNYGLLAEPVATNLVFPSDFAANWTADNATLTTYNTTAPDGSASAAKQTAASGAHNQDTYRTAGVSLTTGTTYTLSVFVKSGNYNYVSIAVNNGSTYAIATCDLSSGTVTQHGSSTITYVSSAITSFGNSWYRVALTFTTAATAAHFPFFALNSSSTPTYSASGQESWTAAGTEFVYLWCPQIETGSVATSPVPTYANTATVTRAADKINVATSKFPFADGAAGTVVMHLTKRVIEQAGNWTLSDGTNANMVQGYTKPAGGFWTNINAASVSQMNTNTANAFAADILSKCGLAWDTNDGAGVLDNGTRITDASVTLPTGINILYISGDQAGNNPMRGWIYKMYYLPRRMNNTDLSAATV